MLARLGDHQRTTGRCGKVLNSFESEITSVQSLEESQMTERVQYVKGSEMDNWHWCKNCTQYPMYVRQRQFTRPSTKLCPQCKAKEDNGDCTA